MTVPTQVAEVAVLTAAHDPFNPADPIDLTSGEGALYFEDAAQLVVYYISLAGVATLLELGADYEIAGEGMAGQGTITPTYAGAEAGGTLHVSRATPLTQEAVYEENDGFPAKTTERVFDRDRLVDQDINAVSLRSLRVPRWEDVVPVLPDKTARTNKFLRGLEDGSFDFVSSLTFAGLGVYRDRFELVRLVTSNIVVPIVALNPDELAAPTDDIFSDQLIRITLAHRTYADAQTHDQIGVYELYPSMKGATGVAYANARLVSFFADPALYSFGFDPTALVDDGAFTITSSAGNKFDRVAIAITPGTNWSAGGPLYNNGNTQLFVQVER